MVFHNFMFLKMKRHVTKKLLLVVICFSLFCVAKDSSAKDLFVATDGNDTVVYDNNDMSHPWLTPQRAWYQARAGDTVYFRGGTYNVSSTIDTKYNGYGGTESAPIRFTSYENESVTISGSIVPIFSIQKPYNYVSHINFIGPGTCFEIGEDISAPNFWADHCTYSMLTGGDNNGFIYAWPGSRNNGLKLTNSVIHGPSNYSSIHQNSNGIVLFLQSAVTIENNEIYNVPIGIYFKHGNTIGGTEIQINKNYIHHTNRYGMEINSQYGTYSNNILGPSCAGIRINESNGGPVGDNNIIDHNTLSGSSGLVLSSDDDGANGNVITNNIFSSRTPCCSNNTWDYNLYVSGSAIGSHDIGNHSPTYAGGASPSSIAGFALTSSSYGYHAASDGKDMGADVSLVGPDADAPLDVTAPASPSGLAIV